MDILNALWGLLGALLWSFIVVLAVPAALWVALMVWGVVFSTKENKSLDKWMEDFDED